MFGNIDIFQVLKERDFTPEDDNCIGNAVQAALYWHIATEGRSRIHNGVLPNLGPHAYLVIDDRPYSRGVTWPDNHFPELTYETLIQLDKHEDVTVALAFQILTHFTGEDRYVQLLGHKRDHDIGIDIEKIPEEHIPIWADAIFSFAIMCAKQDGLFDIADRTRDIFRSNRL